MDSVRCEVLWSPAQEDRFILHGSSLSLYKVDPLKPGAHGKGQVTKLSDETQATLLSTNNELLGVRCVAWYPASETLVAAGLSTGKVVLTNFGKGSDANSLNGKELIPKHPRQCNYLAWNPLDPKLIAATLDRHKHDSSLLIYDVHQRSDNLSAPLTKPAYELGQNEMIISPAWFYSNPKSLVTGVANRFLRIYDLRDTSRPRCVAYTKAVHGIAVDRHHDHRLASFQENQILLWDTRYFDKPTHTLPAEHKPISRLAWCPTRNNLLACLLKDSPIVKLYDITHVERSGEENDTAVVERYLRPYSSSVAVSWFDWHPSNHNRLLTVSQRGLPRDNTLFEKIAVSWSPDTQLLWACGRSVQQVNPAQLSQAASEDISLKMKRRAKRGYGIQSELWKNGDISDTAHLRNLWRWLHYAKTLLQEEMPASRAPLLLRGIKATLRGEGAQGAPATAPTSDLDLLPWQLNDGHKIKGQKRIFRSKESSISGFVRAAVETLALKLCCWGFEKDTQSTAYIDQLAREGDCERAAAIAVFTLRMGRAIQVLNEGKQAQQGPGLHMVAMALSGYCEGETLWRGMCAALYGRLENPYLRAMFAFLTCDDAKYEEVLKEEELAVVDKVAFACIYLPDSRLGEHIDVLARTLTDKGNLDGICLTGLGPEGITLLQQYVDITGDIQTAAVTSLQGLPNQSVSRDVRVQNWMENYRALLDVWGLWTERAELDVYRHKADSSIRNQQQVYACCNFCGKTIGYTSMAELTRGYTFGSPAMKTKVTSCPGCRKPLPRCALCQVNMGTPAGTVSNTRHRQVTDAQTQKLLAPFSDWFTWCQTCRHGGHANHMTDWFSSGTETECPVTGCTCKCTALDPIARKSQHSGEKSASVTDT